MLCWKANALREPSVMSSHGTAKEAPARPAALRTWRLVTPLVSISLPPDAWRPPSLAGGLQQAMGRRQTAVAPDSPNGTLQTPATEALALQTPTAPGMDGATLPSFSRFLSEAEHAAWASGRQWTNGPGSG